MPINRSIRFQKRAVGPNSGAYSVPENSLAWADGCKEADRHTVPVACAFEVARRPLAFVSVPLGMIVGKDVLTVRKSIEPAMGAFKNGDSRKGA
jgi:hypothetical protein